jgi:hypothetical protein
MKRINTTFIVACFIFSIFFQPSIAGQNTDDKVREFESYYKDNYQETIFIHADKSYYLSGEFIKFKVYCLERLTQRPGRLSRVAYVEILDSANSSQIQARIELKDGSGYGEMYIPVAMNSGHYVLRGYTRWMRNYGPENYFHSIITIVNPFKRLGLKPEPEATDDMLDFYPEGGFLIDGLETTVVFQGKNALGKPVDITGRLVANDTMEVASLRPVKNGMGSFDFLPNLKNSYHVEIFHENDTTFQSLIPVQSRGLSLRVKKSDDQYVFEVFCNEPDILSHDARLLMIVHQKGQILDHWSFVLNSGRTSQVLDKGVPDDGVVTASLFDESGRFVGERKWFHMEAAAPSTAISTDDGSYSTREKVTIDLSALENIAKDHPALSLSVSSSNPQFAGNLLDLDQYLLLDNSIKYVYGIEKYFDGPAEQVKEMINNLLIAFPTTSSAPEFSDENEKVNYLPEHRSSLITGKIYDKMTKEPASGIRAYLSVPGKQIRMYAARSTSDGRLVFEATNFYDRNEIVVQTDYTKDSIHTIEIDNPYSQEYADIDLPAFDIDESLEKFLRTKSQNMQIWNANMKLTPSAVTIPNLDSTSFYQEPDSRYYLDDYTRFVVMEEVMREYVAGVNVRKNRNGFHFMVIDIERNIVYDENPLMLLDGVPVFDADEIIALDPLKVEKIETIKTRFGKGVVDCRGIVSYTTYTGNMAGYTFNENASVLRYDGVQSRKAYHFPSYVNAFERRNTTPDLRNTLLWLPELGSEVLEQGSLDFFTSDDADRYEIRINGIDKNGDPFSSTAEFSVERQK